MLVLGIFIYSCHLLILLNLLHLCLYLLIIHHIQPHVCSQLKPRLVCIWIDLKSIHVHLSIFDVFDMHCVLHIVHCIVYSNKNKNPTLIKIQLTTRNDFFSSFLFWGSGTLSTQSSSSSSSN